MPIRRSRHPVYSCSVLLLHVSGTAEHGRVSAQGGAVTGRHGSRRSHHFSSCTAPQGGPAQALKVLQFVMMTLKISVFRILFFIPGSINPNVLCFIQMSSSDDEAPSPHTGACSSKDPPPPLQSESADDEDQLPKTKKVERPPPSSHRNHARTQSWQRMRQSCRYTSCSS